MLYLVQVKPEFIRDAQIAEDTKNLSDEELCCDLYQDCELEDHWHDCEIPMSVALTNAGNEEDAVQYIAKIKNLDARVLEAVSYEKLLVI